MKNLQKILMLFYIFLMYKTAICQLPLCISLGAGCGPALTLRDLNIRTEAYPFDWLVSSFSSLQQALKDDFEFFLTDIELRPDKTGIIDYYGFHFTHDLPTIHNHEFDSLNADFIGNCTLYHQWEQALPLVREKYQRRIERFRNICLGQKKVFFIRAESSKTEAILLRDFFKEKYPQLDFVLIIFANNLSFTQPWNIPGIINFHSSYWHNPIEWGNLLKQVGPEFTDLIIHKNINFSKKELYCSHCLHIKETILEG